MKRRIEITTRNPDTRELSTVTVDLSGEAGHEDLIEEIIDWISTASRTWSEERIDPVIEHVRSFDVPENDTAEHGA